MSETPEWLDDKGKIIEHKYCQCFLEKQPMLSNGEDFFTTEGIVTDKDRLLRDVFDDIKEHLTGGLVTKAKNLLEAIRMECYDRGELEKYQDRIFLANGTLFLDGRFVEEKGFCLNRLPISYNPNAPQPEVWLRFLSELLEPEDILTLQEFMGYCLIPCTRGQVMLLIKGNGGEGKSRIGVVMHTIFGPNAKNGSIDKVENSAFARADLQHVLVMVDDDTKMEALSSTHYVKSIITAETPMDLERKKEQSFQGDMYVRFMAFSNGDLEALYDKSEGFFRRQLILQTKRKPPERVDDPFLSDKLKQEVEGIFLWCLEGLKRLQANSYRFTISQRAAENKEHAKRNANNLVEFLQSEGYIQLKADSTITSRELYAIYQMWCEDNGYRPIAQRSVSSYLKSHLEDYNLEASNKDHQQVGQAGQRLLGHSGTDLPNNSLMWKTSIPIHPIYPRGCLGWIGIEDSGFNRKMKEKEYEKVRRAGVGVLPQPGRAHPVQFCMPQLPKPLQAELSGRDSLLSAV